VYLNSTPIVRIRDFSVRTTLDKNYRDAQLKVTTYIYNEGEEAVDYPLLEVTLYDKEGDIVGSDPLMHEGTAYIAPGAESTIHLVEEIKSPEKWTAETTNLYTMELELRDHQAQIKKLHKNKIEYRKGW